MPCYARLHVCLLKHYQEGSKPLKSAWTYFFRRGAPDYLQLCLLRPLKSANLICFLLAFIAGACWEIQGRVLVSLGWMPMVICVFSRLHWQRLHWQKRELHTWQSSEGLSEALGTLLIWGLKRHQVKYPCLGSPTPVSSCFLLAFEHFDLPAEVRNAVTATGTLLVFGPFSTCLYNRVMNPGRFTL